MALRKEAPANGVEANAEAAFVSLNSETSDNSDPRGRAPKLDPLALHGIAGRFVRTMEPFTEATPAAMLFQFLTAFGHSAHRDACFRLGPGAMQHCVLYVALVASTGAAKGTSWAVVRETFSAADPDFNEASGLSSREGIAHAASADGAPKALLVHEAEMASLLAVAKREGNTVTTAVRDLWDVAKIQTLTKKDPLKVEGLHFSLVCHITPADLEALWSKNDTNNGFGNRFLWVHAKRLRTIAWHDDPPELELRDITAALRLAIDYARDVGRMNKDVEAAALYEAAMPWLLPDGEGTVAALSARARAYVIRLAMIYALLESKHTIEGPHMAAALAAWDYCRQTLEYYFGKRLSADAQKLLAIITAAESSLTRTQLSGELGRSWEATRLNPALAELRSAGHIRVNLTKAPGAVRTTEVISAAGTTTKNHEFSEFSETKGGHE